MITETEAAEYAKQISSNQSVSILIYSFASICLYVLNIVAHQNNAYGLLIALPISAIVSYYIFSTFHEAVHNAVVPSNRKINDLIGRVFAFILNMDFPSFKKIHQQHHIHANSKRDPDSIFGEQGRRSYVLAMPTFLVLLRIFVVLPRKMRIKLIKNLSSRTKVFIYLYQKDSSQCRVYIINFYLALISLAVFGFDSVFIFCYISSMLAMFIIYPMVTWLPHLSIFEREEHGINKYKTTKIQGGRLSLFTLFPIPHHLTHHLYPSVPVSRLKKMSKFIQPILDGSK
jgi:fatty acid desaturase